MEEYDGKRVKMRYIPDGSFFEGEIVDFEEERIVVMMDDTAKDLIDDPDMIVDTDFDTDWELVEIFE